MKFGSRRIVLVVMGTVVACMLAVALASGQAGQEPRPQMAESVFKNVQVLKGIPVDEFMDTMGMISAAVGLNCLDCHTGDSDKSWDRFAADTTMKQTSRKMLLMVNALNKDNFAGVRSVTCWTCHRGDLRPTVVPNLSVQYSPPAEDVNTVEIRPGGGGRSPDEKPLPLLPLTGGNLEGAKIEATLAFPAGIKQAFSQWRADSTSIDDKDVTVLQGTNPRQPPLNLYFDQSGLLVRMVRFADTPIGRVPTQIDYSDYREVSGVKMPFRWTSTWTDGQITVELTEVQPNVSIDAARFGRPAPAKTRN